MAKNKTKYTSENVLDFVESFANTEQKKLDSYQLIEILEELTGEKAKMWGPTIIGFGNYHYKYKSGHEGDAPVLAFSPRKKALTLYIYSDTEKSKEIITNLGKFKQTKGCIYVNKLSDININVLRELCTESIKYIGEHHECSCKLN